MQQILILGAGLSSSTLIRYLLDHSSEYGWHIVLGDANEELATQKIGGHPNGEGIRFDVTNKNLRASRIAAADIVMLHAACRNASPGS